MSTITDQDKLNKIKDLGKQLSDSTISLHEGIAKKAGLSGTDHKYLGILLNKGPMTAGELATASKLSTGAVTGLVDRLVKKKLVKRVFDKNDRRKINIVADPEKAKKLLGKYFSLVEHQIVALISSFSENEQKIIEKYLHAAIAVVQEVTLKIENSK